MLHHVYNPSSIVVILHCTAHTSMITHCTAQCTFHPIQPREVQYDVTSLPLLVTEQRKLGYGNQPRYLIKAQLIYIPAQASHDILRSPARMRLMLTAPALPSVRPSVKSTVRRFFWDEGGTGLIALGGCGRPDGLGVAGSTV